MIYTREDRQEGLADPDEEFSGMERAILAGTLDFYVKATSPDGRISETVVQELSSPLLRPDPIAFP